MTSKTKYILIVILAMIFVSGSAQNSQVLYFMNLPQNHLMNPALRPSNSLYIGLPGVSGINIGINNNLINFSDVFMKGQSSDSVYSILRKGYNIDKFLDKIKDKNSIEAETSVQLFGLGFSAGKDLYIFFDINDRFDGNFVIPGDFFRLGLKGNESFVGKTIDFSALSADMKYYREYGLGFSKNFTSKLRIGVKGKILSGIAAASIDNRSLGINVNSDYSHTINANLDINMSDPLDVYYDTNNNIDSIVFDEKRFKTTKGITDFILGKTNTGLAFDIGATYTITNKITVSAAITDLGFIRWKKDLSNLSTKNSFTFNGLDMLGVVNGTKTIDEVGKEMLDSLKNSFVFTNSRKPFTTYLPFGVTLGGSYNLTKNVSVGVLSYTRFIGKQVRESLTLSGNLNLGNSFSTSISYTAANRQYDNIGFGLAFRPGIFQFYILTDRIPVTWNKLIINDKGGNILLPANWNTFNLRLGMNLAFGNRIKKKNDKPMIEESQNF
jgi:hypothetical protein